MIPSPVRAAVLAAALAGCGVKAAPRPPERAGPGPLDRRAATSPLATPVPAAAAAGAPCACAPPDPLFAATTKRP